MNLHMDIYIISTICILESIHLQIWHCSTEQTDNFEKIKGCFIYESGKTETMKLEI